MLEAHAHNQLKVLLQSESSIWSQNLTLSRLVARSLRRQDKSLIQLPIGTKEYWWPGLLIPLSLQPSDAVLVLSNAQRQRLFKYEFARLKKFGFYLPIWEELTPPPKGKIWILNHTQFYSAFKNGYLQSKQLIFPEAELLCGRFRDAMSLQISQSDWEHLRRTFPTFDTALLDLHQFLTKQLFVNATHKDAQISFEDIGLLPLRDLLSLLKDTESPSPWREAFYAINTGWASWANLNHKLLDWVWHMQPLEPFKEIQNLLTQSPFLMVTSSWSNDSLLTYLASINCSPNVSVRLKGMVEEDPIQLFVPFRQPLPNTEYFAEYLLDQCRRLILGIQGVSIVLLDDGQLRRQLTSQLAAEFGKRVVYQITSPDSNGVVCCSCSWWLQNHQQLPTPHQLIVAILPFGSMESPLLAAQVKEFKKYGRDWFRDLLLPEVLTVIPYIVQPIRGKQGRVAILDGRLRSRSWGENVFRVLEPWTPLERLLPN